MAFRISRSLGLLLGLALSFTPALAAAQEDEKPLVEYRQKLMTGQRASMASIGDILKFKLPYSSHIAIHARNISEYSKLIADAFKKEAMGAPNDAKVEIWKNPDDFAAKAKAVSELSAKLAEVAGGGDMKAIVPQVTALGDACKSCHNLYRKPEEESYKRK
ncbi:MAG TPA: cytochrome c [Vicinamibacteria bacterium]|jgi:cytochrome c556